MSFNPNQPPPPPSSSYNTSSTYNEAVNDSQLVRTFSIIAVLGSALIFIGGAVAIGVGAAVIGLGGTKYYRILGIAIIVLAVLSFLIAPLRIIASAVLSGGVMWRGFEILSTLAAEGKGDPDWQPTRERALLGIVLSGVGLVVNAGWLTIILLGIVL